MSKETKKTSIGGQAVIEGVMMRGAKSMALSVRDQDGIIRQETYRTKPPKCRKIPIVRGILSFIQSLFGGTAVLMRSADVYGEGEPGKVEKWLAEKLKVNVMGVVSVISLMLGLVLAVALFMLAPQAARKGLESLFNTSFGVWEKNLIEGGLKLLIFIIYLLLCSLIKDVRRTFMYHGAEHKTISCYEKGLELTPENAKKCTRVHDRCGTTFIFFVMIVSIVVFACFESFLYSSSIELDKLVRVGCKIVLLPLIAGLSYELLKGLAKTNCWVFYPLKVPGLLLQRITTKEPTTDMLEVAIASFKQVLLMDADESIPETKMTVAEKRSALFERIKAQLSANGITEEAEAEWIISIALNIKRSEVNTDNLVTPKYVDKVNNLVKDRITGRPLWYCVGDTDFYGYTIKADERVLIPRPETEILVEKALEVITKESAVLDLCTGSGCIAVAIKKKSGAEVTAIDVSLDALALAKENARINNANINFINSDLFSALEDQKFDVIVSNPPYIKSADIETLQKEVKDFEPKLALDGGEDGLDFYRIIAQKSHDYLSENGVLLLECGEDQAMEIASLLTNFSKVEIIKDYENIDRIVKAVK